MSGAAGAIWLSVKPVSTESSGTGGIRVPKRWVKLSVARNRIRRLFRESARSVGLDLSVWRVMITATPPKGLKMQDARKALLEFVPDRSAKS